MLRLTCLTRLEAGNRHCLQALYLVLGLAVCIVLTTSSVGFAQQTSGLGRYNGPTITVDLSSGNVVSANRPFDAWYPASTTKMMTAYVVFKAVREGRVSLRSPVTISRNAANQPPSKAGLRVGQVLTIETALRVLMVKSANDIAVALAESVSGSEPAFIAEMNQIASALGMRRTTFTNPHGLPSRGQVTTAYDLALLTVALLRDFPNRNDFYSMPAVQLGNARWVNSNILLQRYRGAFGFKTGYICDSGFNLVAGAQRGGRTLITVTLGARSGLERAVVTAHNLDEGFRRSGGLFGGGGGTPLANLRPTGNVQTTATRMRPIVCQRPRVRPTADELATVYGTASPAFAPQRSSSSGFQRSRDSASIVLPSSGEDTGGVESETEINVLDVLLGPIVREPRAVQLALGGATGPAVARLGRWTVPNPEARPDLGLAALRPSTSGTDNSQTVLPGQIPVDPASSPALVLSPAATADSGTSPAPARSSNVGQAVPQPVPQPIPRPY